MAVATLAIGMVFVAGVFPVAIHFNTIATERTTGAIVADEAFAKIKLYESQGLVILPSQTDPNAHLFNYCVNTLTFDANEYFYPSTAPDRSKQYCWSALLRAVGDGSYQVTVFISRKLSPNLK